MSLKTDYKDAVFPGSRRYQIVQNEDGTVFLVDVTEYTQEGDKFGAQDVNAINLAIVALQNEQLETVDPMTTTIAGFAADALKTKEAIAPLQTKMASFEQAKGTIAGSALAAALGITASTALATIATKLAGVANRGALNWSGSNTTYTVSAGYYSGGTLNSKTSYTNGYNAGVTAADARVNTSSANYKGGYNAGYSAGNTAGINSQSSSDRSAVATALVAVGVSAAASESITSLCNKIKTLMVKPTRYSGTYNFVTNKVLSGYSYHTQYVSFPSSFATIPNVTVSFTLSDGSQGSQNFYTYAEEVTKSSFKLCIRYTGDARTVYTTWVATT